MAEPTDQQANARHQDSRKMARWRRWGWDESGAGGQTDPATIGSFNVRPTQSRKMDQASSDFQFRWLHDFSLPYECVELSCPAQKVRISPVSEVHFAVSAQNCSNRSVHHSHQPDARSWNRVLIDSGDSTNSHRSADTVKVRRELRVSRTRHSQNYADPPNTTPHFQLRLNPNFRVS